MARTISTIATTDQSRKRKLQFLAAVCYRGWGGVSAGRRIGASASGKTAFRHGYDDQEVSTKFMTLWKRRHADTFPLTAGNIPAISGTGH